MPDKTAKVFCQNPLNNSYPELIYRTGDIVCYDDDGIIHFKGRKDSLIKHMGYRIELGEIEACAAHYEGVRLAAAAVQNDRLILYYCTEDGSTVDEAALKEEAHIDVLRVVARFESLAHFQVDFIFRNEIAGQFVESTHALIMTMVPGYINEGKYHLNIAFGCTGGHHRSVAIANAMAEKFREDGMRVRVNHRDLDLQNRKR